MLFKNTLLHIKHGNFLPNPKPSDPYSQYTLNTQGYRTIEFEDVNWSESIVLLGCSMAFGESLSDSETISYHLAKLTNMPVINLGTVGTSTMYSFYNSLILNNYYPTPNAVVHLWTELSRCTLFDNNHIKNGGIWNTQPGDLFDIWNSNNCNPTIHGQFISMASKAIWINKSKYFSASFFKNTSEILECTYIQQLDDARDGKHPGPQAAKFAAEIIAGNLKL